MEIYNLINQFYKIKLNSTYIKRFNKVRFFIPIIFFTSIKFKFKILVNRSIQTIKLLVIM